MNSLTNEITLEKSKAKEITNQQQTLDESYKAARKTHSLAIKESITLEKKVNQIQHQISELKPTCVALDEKLKHTKKKSNVVQANINQTTAIQNKLLESVNAYKKDLTEIQNRAKAFEDSASERQRALNESDQRVDDAGVSMYTKLVDSFNSAVCVEREKIQTGRSGQLTRQEARLRIVQAMDQVQGKISAIDDEKQGLVTKRVAVSNKVESLTSSLSENRQEVAKIESQLKKITQNEIEINEKIAETGEKLMNARIDMNESSRQKKFQECLDALVRLFPGVHGRLIDLCQPVQRRFDNAISTVLGKNIDAIVVDSFNVGKQCLEVF